MVKKDKDIACCTLPRNSLIRIEACPEEPIYITSEVHYMKFEMPRRTKVTFFLSLATILSLFGYLFITSSWRRFSHSPVSGGFSDRNLQSFENEMAELHHRASSVPHLSAKDMTNPINKVMHEKEGDKLVPQWVVTLVHGKKPLVEETRKDPPPQVKKEDERNLPKDEKKSEVVETVIKTEVEKSSVLNAADALIKGKVERPVNPHDFNYMINEPNKCKNDDGTNKDVFLLVLILSVHKNFENRNAIRSSWGKPTEIDGHRVITMFLLAMKSDSKLQELVLQEKEQYHDIIMEDFVDTYKNLTLKTIMGMKWMSTFCAQAKFMMKTDDDMYVSYANIIKYLNHTETPQKSFVTGMVINGGPIRDPHSKWYMPKTTYPGSKYPPFCSGTGYILSGDVPPKIYSTSLSTPYLYLEDVFVAVCLDKLHIIPKNHREFHNWRTTYTFCHFQRILTAHMVTPTEMMQYWNDQSTNKNECR